MKLVKTKLRNTCEKYYHEHKTSAYEHKTSTAPVMV